MGIGDDEILYRKYVVDVCLFAERGRRAHWA